MVLIYIAPFKEPKELYIASMIYSQPYCGKRRVATAAAWWKRSSNSEPNGPFNHHPTMA